MARVDFPITDNQKEMLKLIKPELNTDRMTRYEASYMIRAILDQQASECKMKYIKANDLHEGDIVTNGAEILTIKTITPTGYVTFNEKKRAWSPINLKKVQK